MPKQRSAPILFKQEVFYDLPDETNGLEIENSLCHYEFLKGLENEENKYSCANTQSKNIFNGYKSENSDSLVSSESSSDPDSSPPVERPKLSDVWNKFTVGENAFKEHEIKNEGSCKNISFAGCPSANKIENTLKNLSLQLNKSSTSDSEFDDTPRSLAVENNCVVFCPSADIKDSGEIILDGVFICGSSSSNKEVCLSDMLTFENYGAEDDFKRMLFTEVPNFNEQRSLLSVVENSSEIADFSGLLGDISLNDEPDKLCSSYSPSSSDIDDSFLNLIESVDSPVFNPETKLKNIKNLGGEVSLNVVENSSEITDFSDLLGDINLNDEPDKLCSPSSSNIDSFLNSVNLIESVDSPVFNPETKLKNFGGEVNCDENISLAALAEQHLQSNGSSNIQHTQVKSEDSLFSLIKESESFNNNWFSPLKSENLYSTKNENCSGNMFDIWADFSQENSKEERTNFETKDENLQIVEENGDFFGSLDIDLTSCLKSLRPVTPLNDFCDIKNDNEIFSSDRYIESPLRFSPLLIQNSDGSPSKEMNINPNRSLFSKALSCKPKKNLSAMMKVLELQSGICSHYFSPSQVSDFTEPCKDYSIESNHSVIGSIGRRIFGQLPQCEVL